MHDGDLAGRPAETDKAELEPEQKGLGEGGVPYAHRRGRFRWTRDQWDEIRHPGVVTSPGGAVSLTLIQD